jgi:hypothetical protein
MSLSQQVQDGLATLDQDKATTDAAVTKAAGSATAAQQAQATATADAADVTTAQTAQSAQLQKVIGLLQSDYGVPPAPTAPTS